MLESEEWVWLYKKMDPYSDGTVNVFTVQKTHEYTLEITHNTVYMDTHTNDNTEWQSNIQRGNIHVNALIGLHKSFIKCYHTKCTGVFLNYSFNHTWIYKITSIKSPIKQTPQYLANGLLSSFLWSTVSASNPRKHFSKSYTDVSVNISMRSHFLWGMALAI